MKFFSLVSALTKQKIAASPVIWLENCRRIFSMKTSFSFFSKRMELELVVSFEIQMKIIFLESISLLNLNRRKQSKRTNNWNFIWINSRENFLFMLQDHYRTRHNWISITWYRICQRINDTIEFRSNKSSFTKWIEWRFSLDQLLTTTPKLNETLGLSSLVTSIPIERINGEPNRFRFFVSYSTLNFLQVWLHCSSRFFSFKSI